MTILAKYPARCCSCSAPVVPGQRIEWVKGSPVRHTTCAGAPAAPVAAAQPSRRSSRPFQPCGYPGCAPGYCDECDGEGYRPVRRYR